MNSPPLAWCTPRRLVPLAALAIVAGCGAGAGTVDEGDKLPFDDAPDSPSNIASSRPASPYRPDSPYAAELDCTPAADESDACPLSRLGCLGRDGTRSPTIDDVLDRLLVTHSWMGDRFREMLERMPSDTLPLVGSVTAAVRRSPRRRTPSGTGQQAGRPTVRAARLARTVGRVPR